MEGKEQSYLVGGFHFSSKEEALVARQEEQRISLLEKKIDYTNIDSIAMLYEKAIHNQVFVTPVGFHFLTKLQSILQENNRPEGMLQIPVVQLNSEEEEPVSKLEMIPEQTQNVTQEKNTEASIYQEVPADERGKVRLSILVEDLQKQLDVSKEKEKKARSKYRNSLLVNIVLVFMIIGLFAITLLGENANVLNYRRALNNQYASWEEELKQRENNIREKEAELNIQSWQEEE